MSKFEVCIRLYNEMSAPGKNLTWEIMIHFLTQKKEGRKKKKWQGHKQNMVDDNYDI